MKSFTSFALLACASLSCAKSLDSVLKSQSSLSLFRGYLKQFDILPEVSDLENITVIAPTDDAYLALAQWGFNLSNVPAIVAQSLLRYHVLDGEFGSDDIPTEGAAQIAHTFLKPPTFTNVTTGAAVKLFRPDSNTITTESGLSVVGGVEESDIPFKGGVLHTLNSSMVLPHNISVTAELNQLNGFLDAMIAAKRVRELEDLVDVTIFFPRTEAMDKMAPLLHLLQPAHVKSVLDYHIVPNKILYAQTLHTGSTTVKALNGAELTVHVNKDGTVFVNNAKIIKTDLLLYGGVAHILEDVLIPRDETFAQVAGSQGGERFPWKGQLPIMI